MACANGGVPTDPGALEETLLATSSPLADGVLRIRLAFGAEADLDLYVSDPQQETVYYANNPSASGGTLDADRRCTDPAPRVEQVEFPAPLPGVYRIGVDYPAPCGGRGAPAAFVLEVRRGAQRVVERGRVAPLRFEPAVADVHLAPGARPTPPE